MVHEQSNSSWLESHGYDSHTQKMQVRTRDGHLYEHDGVTPREYQAFRGAESHGTHYNTHISRVKPTRKIV